MASDSMTCDECGQLVSILNIFQIEGTVPNPDGSFDPDVWVCEECATKLGYEV